MSQGWYIFQADRGRSAADCFVRFPAAFVRPPVQACFLRRMREREGLSSDGSPALSAFWTVAFALVMTSRTSVCSAWHVSAKTASGTARTPER